MVHSDSMSPTSLGIWVKLSLRWELKISLAEGSALYADPHSTFGPAGPVQPLPPPTDPTQHQVVIS